MRRSPRTVTLAAKQQYLALPPGGVLVSHGNDVELFGFWLLIVVAVLHGAAGLWFERHLATFTQEAVKPPVQVELLKPQRIERQSAPAAATAELQLNATMSPPPSPVPNPNAARTSSGVKPLLPSSTRDED